MTQPPIVEQSAPSIALTPAHQLDCLLHTVGFSPIDDVGWIRVTGDDRVRWLNGMVTNSIQDLKPGEGNYSFALNAQGQVQSDLYTFAASADSLLLQTARDHVPAMMAMFDRFIIMDDVQLEDVSMSRFGHAITGPNARELLTEIGLPPPLPASANLLLTTDLKWMETSNVDVIAAYSPLVPRFELWSEKATHEALSAQLAYHARALDGGPVKATALEHLRFLEGTPRFGTDIRDKTLAQETAQTRALHFAKGCYLGQEIVERIRSRGSVHRTFAAFRFEGPLPSTGTAILSEDRPIAELTSVAAIPLSTGLLNLGMGIARRQAIEPGTALTYSYESTLGTATPVNLPIRLSAITS